MTGVPAFVLFEADGEGGGEHAALASLVLGSVRDAAVHAGGARGPRRQARAPALAGIEPVAA